MPEYLAPGVFVEEVSFQPSQIQPASTSVAAMVGPTRSGLVRGVPQLLTSFAFAILALADIVGLPASLLRTNTEALRASLESATGCLFEALTALPPSARFAWASLAAAKNLPLLNFGQWLLPAGLGDADTATVRRLAGLVNGMTGQLHDASTSASQTALGNLVAAAVMAAAHGDPNEAVTGIVATTGGIPRPGIPIRVVLNRPPRLAPC